MRLLVDVGNTRFKWACHNGRVLDDCHAQAYTVEQLPGLLEDCWRDMPPPGQICVANVAGEEVLRAITTYSHSRWRLEPVFAAVNSVQAGVTNAYRDSTQLGIDRWLAVIAAWNKYRSPLLVAGCGTAFTLDAVDAGGRHLGGLITPGLYMMQDCLRTGTHGIAAAVVRTPSLGLGDSTADCIANGAACAIVSAIERVATEMRQKFGVDLRRIITGGDAATVNGLLKEPYVVEPNLVLEGLSLYVTPEP